MFNKKISYLLQSSLYFTVKWTNCYDITNLLLSIFPLEFSYSAFIRSLQSLQEHHPRIFFAASYLWYILGWQWKPLSVHTVYNPYPQALCDWYFIAQGFCSSFSQWSSTYRILLKSAYMTIGNRSWNSIFVNLLDITPFS